MNRKGPIKTLIVDDSSFIRTMLTQVLSSQKDIIVVAGAADPFEARECIIKYRPEVIILDINMPRMDGLTFLDKIVAHYPVPVIMCSTLTREGSSAALEAMEKGAVDFIAKPSSGGPEVLRRMGDELADKIRAAVVAIKQAPPILGTAAATTSFRSTGLDPNQYIVAIGASTGGTEAIRHLLANVPEDFPPVFMVQHMPEGFTASFAGRLDQFSSLKVTEATGTEQVVSSQAVLARGNIQMAVLGKPGYWRTSYGSKELFNRHCPSVDVMFNSVAEVGGRQSIGVLLTGMGNDGAAGLLKMRQAGALTVTQSESSCVVYGMPKAADELGAADLHAAPQDIPRLIIQHIRSPRYR
ncbi:MAG: Chemotaxis response regulator protein-glutamate methylesterase [Phycisphaerae bacterium]|nr:Chemotaxis response regulator protein-glutamate methylesterase [Phycisphaerae bacterium]